MKKIRVLGIAPYEGMKIQMLQLAEEYPQMDLTVYAGDMEQGLAVAQNNFHGNYDVVISRGATAQVLRQHLDIPVIEVEISQYDILCAVKLADGFAKKTAMICFADIQSQVQPLCDLLACDMDIYPVERVEALEPTLRSIQAQQYQAILCDVIVNTTAQRLGIHSYLITSGVESIRSALDQAMFLCDSQQALRAENQFYRQLLQGQMGKTLVFDASGELVAAIPDDTPPEILDLLRQELTQQGERRISRCLEGVQYTIRQRPVTSGAGPCTAFFYEARKIPLSPSQMGIRFPTRAEMEADYYSSIFSFAGYLQDARQEVDQIIQNPAPVILTGEDGTGKEAAVALLTQGEPLCSRPLVWVNCSLLNSRSWDFLLEHHNSPLADQGSVLYFANVDVLSRERQYQLIAALREMEVCRSNRVLFSCVCQSGEYISPVGALFRDELSCLSLYLPPLRQMAPRIPALVNLCLSHLNAHLSRQVLGADAKALALLQNYHWPHNYTQFHRVLEELAVLAAGPIITAEQVRRVLQKERHVGAFSPQMENAAAPLDLNRTLAEISQDVALRVVEEAGGNHTAAAKRLGISRTTLWRLLQK